MRRFVRRTTTKGKETMKKIYIEPSVETYEIYAKMPLLGEASLPKMEGSVVDSEGSYVENTDWGYGGEGQDGDTPDAKMHDEWELMW